MTLRIPKAGARHVSPPVVAVGALALGAILAACGSSGPSTSQSTTTTAQAVTTRSDGALARAEVLPPAAFPAHWKAQGTSSENTQASFFGGSTPSDVATVEECLGIPGTNVDPNPTEAASQEYDDPHSTVTVTDTVDVFPTVADASTDVTAAANPKAPGCIEQLASSELSKGLPHGATVGKVTATDGQVPPYGTNHASIILSFPFTYQGVSFTEYSEIVWVQKGRSESALAVDDTGSPAPAAVVTSLTRAAANRLESS